MVALILQILFVSKAATDRCNLVATFDTVSEYTDVVSAEEATHLLHIQLPKTALVIVGSRKGEARRLLSVWEPQPDGKFMVTDYQSSTPHVFSSDHPPVTTDSVRHATGKMTRWRQTIAEIRERLDGEFGFDPGALSQTKMDLATRHPKLDWAELEYYSHMLAALSGTNRIEIIRYGCSNLSLDRSALKRMLGKETQFAKTVDLKDAKIRSFLDYLSFFQRLEHNDIGNLEGLKKELLESVPDPSSESTDF